MSTNQEPEIALSFSRVMRNGRPRLRAEAYLGDNLLHVNNFEPDSGYALDMFVRRVEEYAEQQGVEQVPINEIRAELFIAAQNIMLGLEPDGSPIEDLGGPEPAAVLAAFGLRVLGETNEQGILVWSQNTQKQSVIKSVAALRTEDVLQFVGSEAANRLSRTANNDAEDETYSLDQLRRAVALAGAAAPRIASATMRGQGVWRHGHRVLIVDGARVNFYDGSRFTRLNTPVVGRTLIEMDSTRQWHGTVVSMVRHTDADRTRQLLQQLRQLFQLWNWSHDWDARVLAGLVPSTLIQTLWAWRPWVAITGASDSGKSTLLGQILRPLFLKGAIFTDRSTEAGLRQGIGHHATPVLIDEFAIAQDFRTVAGTG